MCFAESGGEKAILPESTGADGHAEELRVALRVVSLVVRCHREHREEQGEEVRIEVSFTARRVHHTPELGVVLHEVDLWDSEAPVAVTEVRVQKRIARGLGG